MESLDMYCVLGVLGLTGFGGKELMIWWRGRVRLGKSCEGTVSSSAWCSDN